MEKIYNKLIRDKIPNIIEEDNCIPVIRILNNDEYKVALENKLFEECKEVLEAKNKNDRLLELADMLEVIKAIARLDGFKLEDVIDACELKKSKRGSFDKKIFLEKIIDKYSN